jgi:hypothetical protein
MMTARERFDETFRYGNPDRVFMMRQWTFGDTNQRWLREGMPWDVHFNQYFGFDRNECVPVDTSPFPGLQTKVVEEGPGWHVEEDEFGGRRKSWTNRELGMSQWLSYPIRGRETWERWKERLNPDAANRYPEYWDDLKRTYAVRDYPLGINAGSFYGWIRNWVGMEHLALMYYDCPDLVHEMTEYVTNFMLKLMERTLSEIPDLDYGLMWEDMAMKTGPLISPKLFREFMLEPMKRVTKVLNDYGIDIIMVDSDGNVDDLIPLWLEANVNLIYPMEVAAGCDMLKYREQYGKELLIIGGIDKRELRDGYTKKDVEREVMSKVPALIEQGGYSPMVDHAVPPDVPLENFKHYIDLVNDICT